MLIQTKSSLMEKAFTEMNSDEWELLYNKNSHTIVQEQVFPSQAMEEEELSQGSKDLNPIQPNVQATEVELYDEVVEEEVVEEEKDQFSNHEKQSEDNEEEEAVDEQARAFESMAYIISERKSESISFTEKDDEEDEEEEEEEVGEIVEYTGPESKKKGACNAFRLKNLLRSAGLAAATFSIFILQKSMPKNQKIQFKISKNEKAKQLFQHQQEVSEPLPATAHSLFNGHYDEWY